MRKALPETWTHIRNVNVLQIGFALKLCGIEWRSDADLANAMGLLERMGLVQRNGYTIRRAP